MKIKIASKRRTKKIIDLIYKEVLEPMSLTCYSYKYTYFSETEIKNIRNNLEFNYIYKNYGKRLDIIPNGNYWRDDDNLDDDEALF